LDCDFIATGHYAQVREENNRFVVSKGLDENKDQSYVLWGLTQQSLSRTQFPLGQYRKSEIRQMALDMGYDELVKKSESYEICFVPDNDYRGFLKRKVDGLEQRVDGGNFVNREGKILGKHKGYPFYTIGQRKGLEIAVGEPLYVISIHPETNTVVLGKEEELNRKGMWVRGLNMGKYAELTNPLEAVTKIRYKNAGTASALYQEGNRMKVIFDADVKGIAPGQSAVFYEGDDVIGGGWIESSFEL
jgi:tRNA-specific 2-thiouridylase